MKDYNYKIWSLPLKKTHQDFSGSKKPPLERLRAWRADSGVTKRGRLQVKKQGTGQYDERRTTIGPTKTIIFKWYISGICCQLGDYIVTYHLLREPETAIDFRGYYPYFEGSFVSSHHFRSTSPGCCSSTFDSWQLADSHALVACGGGAACPGWDFSETLY